MARCGDQVLSDSTQPFCCVPAMLSLIRFAPPQLSKTPSFLSQPPVSIPALWLGADVVLQGWAKQELSFSPSHWRCPAGMWDMGHTPGDPEWLWGQTRGSPSQPFFSQFPIDGSRGLLFLQLQFGGTEQTLSKQGISIHRRGHHDLQSLLHSLILRSQKDI